MWHCQKGPRNVYVCRGGPVLPTPRVVLGHAAEYDFLLYEDYEGTNALGEYPQQQGYHSGSALIF